MLYASDVFVEMAENVVVGESTGTVAHEDLVARSTINNVIVVPLTDPRTPAGPPINSFGFEIDPASIPAGSAFSVAGFYANNRIYYHTLEADAGTLDQTISRPRSASCARSAGPGTTGAAATSSRSAAAPSIRRTDG